MNNLDLTHLETLLAAATPGPWHNTPASIIFNEKGKAVACCDSHYTPANGYAAERTANAELLLALRNAAPALIARVRELENPQIATVVDPDTGFTINGPEWNALPLKARLIIQELQLQNDVLNEELSFLQA